MGHHAPRPSLDPLQVALLGCMVDAEQAMDDARLAIAASLLLGLDVAKGDAAVAVDALTGLGLAWCHDPTHPRHRRRHHATHEGLDVLRAYRGALRGPSNERSDEAVANAIFVAGRIGATLDQAGMRRVLDAAGPADEAADRGESLRLRKVTEAAEAFVTTALPHPSMILDGLADRPRPGTKASAREAVVDLLQRIHALRTTIQRTKPFRIVASGAEPARTPAVD